MDIGTIYLPLKDSHMLLVIISVAFFCFRAISHMQQLSWQTKKWAKISPHIIDSLLFITGVILMFVTTQFPFEHNWLTSKMILLVGYILFGIKTMRSHAIMQQRLYFSLAMLCILLMITVARTHHPLGLFSLI